MGFKLVPLQGFKFLFYKYILVNGMLDTNNITKMINKINAIDKHALYVTSLQEANSSVSDSDIKNAEQLLGFTLCEDYRTFLKAFGHMHTREMAICGLYYEDGTLETPLISETSDFFEKEFAKGVDRSAKTVVSSTMDGEYFYILDHETSVVTPFDPFSRSYVEKNSQQFCDFLFEFVAEELELTEKYPG